MNNKKVEYNSKYQTGKEDGFIILDKKEVPVDKLFKTYEKALKYIQKHGKINLNLVFVMFRYQMRQGMHLWNKCRIRLKWIRKQRLK